MLKKNFKQVLHIKPASSRSGSVEMFLLAKHFKGRTAETQSVMHVDEADEE